MENKSTYWLIFELIWRDFYKFFAMKHGDRLFKSGGTAAGGKFVKWRADDAALSAWKNGTTGFPMVDANMRELKATGFMSNRGPAKRRELAGACTPKWIGGWGRSISRTSSSITTRVRTGETGSPRLGSREAG